MPAATLTRGYPGSERSFPLPAARSAGGQRWGLPLCPPVRASSARLPGAAARDGAGSGAHRQAGNQAAIGDLPRPHSSDFALDQGPFNRTGATVAGIGLLDRLRRREPEASARTVVVRRGRNILGPIGMSALYSAARLKPDEADMVFPLMSLRHPALSLRDWRGTVRRLNRTPRKRGGLMVVRNLRGCVLAVFAYRLGETLVGEIVLRVTDLIMGRLPGDALPDAVAAAASGLAQELGHARVAIECSDDGSGDDVARVLSQAGFEDGGRLLVRTSTGTGADRRYEAQAEGSVAGLAN